MCEYSIIFLSKHGCPVGTVGGCAEPHPHTHRATRGREPPTSPRVPLCVPSNFLPRSGHGWFTVFLILFGAALYLSIGIGLNRYKYGMQASRPFRRVYSHPGIPRTRTPLESTHPPLPSSPPPLSLRHAGGRVDTASRVLAAGAGPRP